MISITNKTHRHMIRTGYGIEQVIPEGLFESMIPEMNLEGKRYEQVRFIHSNNAFSRMRFVPAEKSIVVYAKYSAREKKERRELLHELMVRMKDRETGKSLYLNLAA